MSNADIKGSIPGMIKNELAKKQGEVAAKIEEVMKAEKIMWIILTDWCWSIKLIILFCKLYLIDLRIEDFYC